jgi:hypothetical protein
MQRAWFRRSLALGWLGFALTAAGACSSESSVGSGAKPAPEAGSDVASQLDSGGDGDVAEASPDADASTDADAGVASDATADSDADDSCDSKSKNCATQFGSLFTKSNARADGTLVALVRPSDTQCALPNGTHVVLQLSMLGQVQRLVASVDGVAVTTHSAPLLGPPYAEGWHENVTLEYAPDLGVHSTDFTPVSLDEAVTFVCSHLQVGAPVSVFAYSDGTLPSSAHQIHSNDGYPDGAIVVDPTSPTATYLLFRYLDQVF